MKIRCGLALCVMLAMAVGRIKEKQEDKNAKSGGSSLSCYPPGDNFSAKISTALKCGQWEECAHY